MGLEKQTFCRLKCDRCGGYLSLLTMGCRSDPKFETKDLMLLVAEKMEWGKRDAWRQVMCRECRIQTAGEHKIVFSDGTYNIPDSDELIPLFKTPKESKR